MCNTNISYTLTFGYVLKSALVILDTRIAMLILVGTLKLAFAYFSVANKPMYIEFHFSKIQIQLKF